MIPLLVIISSVVFAIAMAFSLSAFLAGINQGIIRSVNWIRNLDSVERVLFSMIGILVVGLTFVFGTLVYKALDEMLGVDREGVAIIDSHHFQRAHLETSAVMVGKIIVPINRLIPDTWYIVLRVGNRYDRFYLRKTSYDAANDGDKIKVTYRLGALSDELYIRTAWIRG